MEFRRRRLQERSTRRKQGKYNGHHRCRDRGFVLRPVLRLHQSLRHSLSGRSIKMLLDYFLGSGVTLFLLVYLTYALVRPERF